MSKKVLGAGGALVVAAAGLGFLLLRSSPGPPRLSPAEVRDAVVAFDPGQLNAINDLNRAAGEASAAAVPGLAPLLGDADVNRRFAALYVTVRVARSPADLDTLARAALEAYTGAALRRRGWLADVVGVGQGPHPLGRDALYGVEGSWPSSCSCSWPARPGRPTRPAPEARPSTSR